MKTNSVEVDKSDQPADSQKKSQKKNKKQMAEPVVEPQLEEKKPAQSSQKSQKNEKNSKKKNSTKPAETVVEATPIPPAVAAVETVDTAATGTSKSKKLKAKKEKKAAAAKQQQQTENDKNTLNTAQANAVKTEKLTNEKRLSAKQEAVIAAADSNKVAFINQRLLEITHFCTSFDFTYFVLFLLFGLAFAKNFWFSSFRTLFGSHPFRRIYIVLFIQDI